MPLSKPGKNSWQEHFPLLTLIYVRCTVFAPFACLLVSHVISASCCWVWAVDADNSPDREKSLEMIRYLVPDVLNGAFVDSLSGHALSAAGLAASFLLEANERARLPAPPLSICSVIKAQKPGWSLLSDPRESCDWKLVLYQEIISIKLKFITIALLLFKRILLASCKHLTF